MIRRLSKSDKYVLQAGEHAHRPAFTQPHFDQEFAEIPKGKETLGNRLCNSVRKGFTSKQIRQRLLGLLPIIGWVRHYNLRQDLIADIIAGFTVAIFHVPQSEFIEN